MGRPGQSHEHYLGGDLAVCAAPSGAESIFLATFPTLKRGANNRCASGAIELGTSLINKVSSCDCPDEIDRRGNSPWLFWRDDILYPALEPKRA